LEPILSKITTDQISSTVQNWMVFRAISGLTNTMSQKYMATEDPLNEAISGTTSRVDRYITCIDLTNKALAFPIGSIYVQAAFNEESKQVMKDMIKNVKTSFEDDILPAADWMDSETKSIAQKKEKAVMDFIGYPDYIVTDKAKMDKDYEDYKIENGKLFSNAVQGSVRKYAEDLAILPKPTERSRWSTGPAIVNAWYSPTRNTITFPAGILQAPFYDKGASFASNYGAIGTVIGHELTHGFDDNGKNYDEIGNKVNWWTDASKKNFDEKTKCMSDQYSSYYWDQADMYLNGPSTLGENIADNGGIHESFAAYKIWLQDHDDIKMPGMSHLTFEQQFFLGFSQVWCAKYTDNEAEKRIKSDVHSPAKFRVLGTLSNIDEFGKAFNCKQGVDTYYPKKEDTCRVW